MIILKKKCQLTSYTKQKYIYDIDYKTKSLR